MKARKDPMARFKPLLVMIHGTMAVNRISVDELAAAAGLSRAAMYTRFRLPWRLSLEEIGGIRVCLGIPEEEMKRITPL